MENNPLRPKDNETPIETKVYKIRWYILSVFIYYSLINAIQMTEYSSITEIIASYYNVSSFAVNWTSLLYMVLYPVFVVPSSYIVEKKGLRTACICGCVGTAIGTSIKVFSIARNNFWVVILGQTLTAASLVFIMCLPPKIAAVWFKPSEASLACSLGTLGPNLGNAIGYILTVSIVSKSNDMIIMEKNIRILCWTITALILPVTIGIILYFPSRPSLPPSKAQSNIREKVVTTNRSQLTSIKNIITMNGVGTHMVAYGINVAVFSAMMILLSEFVNSYFEEANEDAGRMGFCMMIFGLIGSIVTGVYLDISHHYKGTCIFIYGMATISILLLIAALEFKSKICTYIVCGCFGIFINPFIPAGFEFGIELTYPSEESTVAGILFATSQAFSVLITIIVAFINMYLGPFWALTILALVLGFGSVIESLVPNTLLRQNAFKGKNRCIT